MEELSYVLTRDFVSCFPVFFFSLPLNFTLLAASISHFLTAAMKFSCFSSIEIRLLCFQSLALALPGFHVSVNIKNNVEKDTTLSFFFSLSKSPGGHAISFHTCLYWCACGADGQEVGWT